MINKLLYKLRYGELHITGISENLEKLKIFLDYQSLIACGIISTIGIKNRQRMILLENKIPALCLADII